uniref:Secreted protein n=1 Tax=Ascaris lumbricoides TaxID=6252 RepID=A0A0M3IV47_ASCLU
MSIAASATRISSHCLSMIPFLCFNKRPSVILPNSFTALLASAALSLNDGWTIVSKSPPVFLEMRRIASPISEETLPDLISLAACCRRLPAN